MVNDTLRIAVISDIHLGHPNTTTMEIIANLERAFPDNAETGELDIVFLAGDIFDRLLYLPDENVLEIRLWINRFLRICKRRDVAVRVLEGTPSHDWGQSKIFSSVNEIGQIGADLAYQNTLCIEYIERFGIHVLYVPDEWEFETDDTWLQVTQLLKDHGLERVDYAVMHGAFGYQLPSHVSVPTHKEERYLSIVNHYVFIGHVHKHSSYDRILVPGSFDRLCHGEEETKGHLRVTVRKNADDEILFVPNEHAKRYVTINCEGLTLEDALAEIERKCEGLPKGSFTRIQAKKDDGIINSLDTLKDQYPWFTWSSKISTKAMTDKESLVDLRAKYKGIEIKQDNIEKLLMARIEQSIKDPVIINRCKALLQEVV